MSASLCFLHIHSSLKLGVIRRKVKVNTAAIFSEPFNKTAGNGKFKFLKTEITRFEDIVKQDVLSELSTKSPGTVWIKSKCDGKPKGIFYHK